MMLITEDEQDIRETEVASDSDSKAYTTSSKSSNTNAEDKLVKWEALLTKSKSD